MKQFKLSGKNKFNTIHRYTDEQEETADKETTDKIVIDWSSYDGVSVTFRVIKTL